MKMYTANALATDRIRGVEELTANSWPALNTLVYDGWLLRFARNYTRRANSISALYASSLDIEDKLTYCEAAYSARQQPTLFKLTSACQPADLDSILEDRGYAVSGPSMVMTHADLSTIPAPDHQDVQLLAEATPAWIDAYMTMNEIAPQHLATMRDLLAQIRLPKAFAFVLNDGVPVALGLAVVEREYVGFYDIVVDAQQRGRGWGRQLMLNLLHFAKEHGATRAYLQVLGDNSRAVRLYSGLGFVPTYDYWYRTKDFTQ
ncbi:MAG: GNAT family N-acetyltransferase [Anaerolineae bacterium]|nr:GNAT family N-acetyltransferase [Anaerolineae bacterium]